jgi:hypothetical protein
MAKKTKPKAKATKTGRPSLYKPEYCELLEGHMKSGLSFEAFAGVVGVSRDTLYEWKKVHKEFSDTIKRSVECSLLFWEKMGIAGMTGQIKGFSAAIYCFNMKNRFGWRDVAPESVAPKQNDDLADALAELDRERDERVRANKKAKLLIRSDRLR